MESQLNCSSFEILFFIQCKTAKALCRTEIQRPKKFSSLLQIDGTWRCTPAHQCLVSVKRSHLVSCLLPEINANRGEMMGGGGRRKRGGDNVADREARPEASQTSFSAAAPSLPDKGDAGGERAIPPNPVPLPCARKRLSGGEDP